VCFFYTSASLYTRVPTLYPLNTGSNLPLYEDLMTIFYHSSFLSFLTLCFFHSPDICWKQETICASAGMREVWKLTQKNDYNKDLYINWESSTLARNLSMKCRASAFNAQGSTITIVVVWSSGSRVADMLVACSLMAVHKTGLSSGDSMLSEQRRLELCSVKTWKNLSI
jgi:hypothetical protein